MKMCNTFSCGELFYHQKQILLCGQNIIERFPQLDVKILPFERLHRNHRDVMKSFVDWLDIKWHENLMTSTMHGKLWWGNGQLPRNGTNPNWKVYQPAGFLEKKDWMMFKSFAYDRMTRLGYINKTGNKTTLTKAGFLLLLLLPTAAEWSALKSILSFRYWRNLLSKLKEDVDDPHFRNFDYYSKQELPQYKKAHTQSHIKIIRNLRIFRHLLRNIQLLNPVKWIYYVLKRIFLYAVFADRDIKNEKTIIL